MLKWLQRKPSADSIDNSKPSKSPSKSWNQSLAQTGKALLGALWHESDTSSEATQNIPAQQQPLSSLELNDLFDSLEESLLKADTGLETALSLIDALRAQKTQLKTRADVLQALRIQFLSHLPASQPLVFSGQQSIDHPACCLIVLVVGVNGAGKTTLIGKLAHRAVQQGQRVLIGAGDTFRAAAEDQLAVWAKRAGAQLIAPNTSDPAAVVFETLQQAQAQQANLVLLDTAGRLQNKLNLMEELRKIRRIIDKFMADKPETTSFKLETLLVLDATTGQNALSQAKIFHEATPLSGVALTKLDGSAKGGVVFAIAQQFGLPVKLVGVGEGLEDLRDFTPEAFVSGIFGEDSGVRRF